MSVDEELRELNRRAEEMENNPMVCISYEKIYNMVETKIG